VITRKSALIFLFVISLTWLHGAENGAMQSYFLLKARSEGVPGYSGDRQHGQAGDIRPLRVRVINALAEPVAGIPVIFEVVAHPAGGSDYRLDRRLVPTDSSGMAVVNFMPGTSGGEYQVIARIRSDEEENIQLFTLYVRDSGWLLYLFAGLVGGLALFLMGMDIMSRGLLKSAGDKMRSILSRLTNNRVIGMGLGAFVTMIIQSSSATNVMLVSFVNARLMQFRQSLGVMLGAAIGTTITAQLIAFRLTDFSLLFLAAGFALQSFAVKEQYKHAGGALLGFGMLFFGMHIMSEAMFPLRSYDPFIELLLKLEYPLLGILVGTVFTALIQSSSAFIGIMIILGMQGLISLEASVPLLFGANIGTAVTALLAGIKSGHEARKVALAVTLFKVFGVLLFIWWIKPFAVFVEGLSPDYAGGTDQAADLAAVIPRQIANAHTIYNVFVALLVLPFTGLLAKAVERMMPSKETQEDQRFSVRYLDDNMIKTPVLALNLAKQEVIRMGEMVHEMAESVLPVFTDKNPLPLESIETKEQNVNYLRDRINSYLLKISRIGIREARVNESFQILYTVKEFELIADVISGPMQKKARSWLVSNYVFSPEGKQELIEYHTKTCKQIKRAIEVFNEVNIEKALEMKQKYKQYRNIAFEFEKQHYERLKQEQQDTLLSSKTHLELMAMLRNISSHATNIARILLQWEESRSNDAREASGNTDSYPGGETDN
jgi:phosphate:Na+ symporter